MLTQVQTLHLEYYFNESSKPPYEVRNYYPHFTETEGTEVNITRPSSTKLITKLAKTQDDVEVKL